MTHGVVMTWLTGAVVILFIASVGAWLGTLIAGIQMIRGIGSSEELPASILFAAGLASAALIMTVGIYGLGYLVLSHMFTV